MEQRFGYDFSQVRIHTGPAAERSTRDVDAHAYTVGPSIVFNAGRFAPGTTEGRRLLAHELTHVIQQGASVQGINRATLVQRDGPPPPDIPAPADLLSSHISITEIDIDAIVDVLFTAVKRHPEPAHYLQDFFEAASANYSKWEDDIGAGLIARLGDASLDKLARSEAGRYALSLIYQAIITGDVSEFQRKHATRVLFAKARQDTPEEFARLSQQRRNGQRTRIFPIRYMRVTGGDYAPPTARLLPNGYVRVRYPTSVLHMDTFQQELRTLGNFFTGEGEDVNVNEIVGIKDYESGGHIDYVPALALIDYANRAHQSTMGKILEVSAFAASFGLAGGAAAGGRAAAGEMGAVRFTSTAIWGHRISQGLRVADTIANVVGVAAFVIDENREWIVSKLGRAGRLLVKFADVANSAAAIYGLGRLTQIGVKFANDFRKAAVAARAEATKLNAAEAQLIQQIDDHTAAMARQIDDEAAKATKASGGVDQPTVGGAADDVTPPAKGTHDAPDAPTTSARNEIDEIHASARAQGIPPKELERQFDRVAHAAGDPKNVRVPQRGPIDAELKVEGHQFQRNAGTRTWCRRSRKKCDLRAGRRVNTSVDAAVAANRAREEARIAAVIERANKRNAQQSARVKRRVGRRTDAEVEKADLVSWTPGKTSNTTAPKSSPLKQDVAANIDENLAVGEPNTAKFGGRDVPIAERRRRALDLDERDFKDAVTNQKTKAAMMEVPIGKSTTHQPTSASLKDNPNALFDKKFTEIEEVKKIADDVKKKMKGKTTRPPGELKAELNRRIWEEIRNAKKRAGRRIAEADPGWVVAQAFERGGWGYVTVNGTPVLRALTARELRARGFRFVKGEGWVRVDK
jgi:hypothetical protein